MSGPVYEILWTIDGTNTEAQGIRQHVDVPRAVEDALRHGATDIIINRVKRAAQPNQPKEPTEC